MDVILAVSMSFLSSTPHRFLGQRPGWMRTCRSFFDSICFLLCFWARDSLSSGRFQEWRSDENGVKLNACTRSFWRLQYGKWDWLAVGPMRVVRHLHSFITRNKSQSDFEVLRNIANANEGSCRHRLSSQNQQVPTVNTAWKRAISLDLTYETDVEQINEIGQHGPWKEMISSSKKLIRAGGCPRT